MHKFTSAISNVHFRRIATVALGLIAFTLAGCEVASYDHMICSISDGYYQCTCEQGFLDCDGVVSTGCEAHLATDVYHCGTCNHACTSLQTCDNGQCVCNESNCFCADLMTDAQNCGACGVSIDDGNPCTVDMCLNGTPVNSNLSKWTPCFGDDRCDGEGTCKTGIGRPCMTNDACIGGSCIDGVCCESACNGTCEACVETKTGIANGRCEPISYLEDPEEECPNGVCDGSGQCTDPGTACSNASDCATGYCVDGVCCNSPCTESCFTCNRVGHVGTCTPISLFDDDANGMPSCAGTANSCNGNGVCKSEAGQPCMTNAECLSGHCEGGMCGASVMQVGPLVWQWHEDTSVLPIENYICEDSGYQPIEYPRLSLSAIVARTDGSVMGTGTHLHGIFGMPSGFLDYCFQVRQDYRGPHPFVFEVDGSGQLTGRQHLDDTYWSMEYGTIPHCFYWCESWRREVPDPLLALAGGDVVFHRRRELTHTWTNQAGTEIQDFTCEFGEFFKSGLPQWSLGTSDVCSLVVKQIAGDDAGNVFVRNWSGIKKFNAGGQVVQTLPDPFNGSGMSSNGAENPLVMGPQGEFHVGTRDTEGIWLGKADATGILEWSKTVPSLTNWNPPFSHAVDATGNTLLAFDSTGIIDLGNGPMPRLGPRDLVLAKLDPQGNVMWAKRFGGPGFDARAFSLRRTGNDEMALIVDFSGMVDFGVGVFESSPVLMKLDAQGMIVWHANLAAHFSFPVVEQQWVLSGHPSGEVFVSGWGYAPYPPGNSADWKGKPRDLRFVVAKYGP